MSGNEMTLTPTLTLTLTLTPLTLSLSRVVSGKEMMKTACGTPGYVAPEVRVSQG